MTGAPLRVHDPIIIPSDEGLFCPVGDFHIGPWRPVVTAVITHAHADHARAGSEHYLAQHHSLPIMRHRLGEHRFTGLDYGEQRRFGAITLSLHPAGHVLGSAQVRVEHDDGRVWVVTGDYKRDPDPTCAPFGTKGSGTYTLQHHRQACALHAVKNSCEIVNKYDLR